jgi:hypothetical protein
MRVRYTETALREIDEICTISRGTIRTLRPLWPMRLIEQLR